MELTVPEIQYMADVLESVLPMYSPIMPGAFEKQIAKYREMDELPQYYLVWILEHDGERVGFLGFVGINEEVGYLVALYIHANHQRKGFGGVALERFCARLAKEGYKELVLFAHQQAEWALDFYWRHGFQLVTDELTEICKYRGGILAKIAFPKTVLMRRELGPILSKESNP